MLVYGSMAQPTDFAFSHDSAYQRITILICRSKLKYLTVDGWTEITYYTGINDAPMINPTDFGDPLNLNTFHHDDIVITGDFFNFNPQ